MRFDLPIDLVQSTIVNGREVLRRHRLLGELLLLTIQRLGLGPTSSASENADLRRPGQRSDDRNQSTDDRLGRVARQRVSGGIQISLNTLALGFADTGGIVAS